MKIQIQAYDKDTRMGVPLVFEGAPTINYVDGNYIDLKIEERVIQIPRDELGAVFRLFR